MKARNIIIGATTLVILFIYTRGINKSTFFAENL